MATINYEVIKHLRNNGMYRIRLRITHKRKTAYIPTDIYVPKSHVNKSFQITNRIDYESVFNLIDQHNSDLNSISLYLDSWNIEQIVEYLKKEKRAGVDFIAFARDHIATLKAAGRMKTANSIQTTINSLERFTGCKTLPAENMNSSFLYDYENWLRKNKVNDVSIDVYMRNIRMTFNAARKQYNDEDNEIIRIKNYPFSKYKMPRAKETKKRALSIEDIRKIRDYTPKLHRERIGQAAFMISFYLAGMNTADIFHCPAVSKGRISYNRMKTKGKRKDEAFISLKIQPELIPWIEKYRGKDTAFNFREYYGNHENFNKAVDKGLNSIGKKLNLSVTLTSYYARHSFATIARNDCNISKDDVHMSLNHVEKDMAITDIYIKPDWSKIDNAVRKVLDLLGGNKKSEEKPRFVFEINGN